MHITIAKREDYSDLRRFVSERKMKSLEREKERE